MAIFSLPPRLLAISNLVPKGSVVADIGTDHALLPIYLIENGIAKSAIASDIADGPLKSALKNITAHTLEGKIEIVKSDGLVNVYPFTPETVIIAGMGGETIRDIIANCEFSVSGAPLFLLQPMTHTELLREYLMTNGFSILNETVIQEEHRFYVIISAKFSEKSKHYFELSGKTDYELGGIAKQTSIACENYLKWRRQTAQKALQGIQKSQGFEPKEKELTALIDEIDKRLSE